MYLLTGVAFFLSTANLGIKDDSDRLLWGPNPFFVRTLGFSNKEFVDFTLGTVYKPMSRFMFMKHLEAYWCDIVYHHDYVKM